MAVRSEAEIIRGEACKDLGLRECTRGFDNGGVGEEGCVFLVISKFLQ